MTDIETIYNCVFDKTYQNKIQFLIELEKVSDRKLVAGLLMDLSIRSEKYEVGRDEVLEICSEFLSKEELETEYLIDANTYYIEVLKERNSEKTAETNFLLDFYSYLVKSSEASEEVKNLVSDRGDITDIDDFLKKNKQYLPMLKEEMIKSELYEIISLIDKHL